MNDHSERYETIDIEEIIMEFDEKDLDNFLLTIENEDDVTLQALQHTCDKPYAYLDAKLHRQIDPSYQ